jgi:threonine dehydratase
MLRPQDVEAAAARLAPYLQPTPTARSRFFSALVGCDVYLKEENRQRGGSFKLRGALNRLLTLPPDERQHGVIAASAGNHGQGVAIAAGIVGCRATVVMPVNAALAKVEATRGYGARVVLHGASYDDAQEHAHRLAEAHHLVYVPAFDDLAVMAGQGTVALEMLAAVPDLDTLVVPVGGGGLISGMATVAKAHSPPLRVYGVQAAGAAAAVAAFHSGRLQPTPEVHTFADGIAVKAPSALTLAHLRERVDDMVAVPDDWIAEAVVLLMERTKLVVEGAGAAGLAALLAGRLPVEGRRIGVVLSGGNIDLTTIDRIVQHGLTAAGRYLVFRTRLEDRPGELARLSALLARLRVNILEVRHYVRGVALAVNEVELELTVETRNVAHGEQVLARLREAGYAVVPEPSIGGSRAPGAHGTLLAAAGWSEKAGSP